MERTDSGGRQPVRGWSPGQALAAFQDGVTVICEISAQFGDAAWAAPSPCPEWRVIDLAGHLRCVADDFHEYLDDAPASRLARLMATGVHPDTLARKLARQNAAELAALPDASGPEHIEAFASSARAYAQRLLPIWDLPHHQYRDVLVTVGGMAGAACAEWHLHAWDLARAQGKDYRPADPDMLLRGWEAGMPHVPLEGARPYEASPGETSPYDSGPYATGPYGTGPHAAGSYDTGSSDTGPHAAGPLTRAPLTRPHAAGSNGARSGGSGSGGAGWARAARAGVTGDGPGPDHAAAGELGPARARPVEEYQRILIAISNCSPSMNRCCMAPVKLVLYTGGMSPLPFLPCYPTLYCPSSD